MAKIDKNTVNGLSDLEQSINQLINHIIVYRQSTVYRREYRKIGVRLEKALASIQDAIELCK